MAESATPPLVLVTGASGFVSTWLIKELLEKGEYQVRGTVRNKNKQEKVQPLHDLVPDAKHPLDLVEADLSDKESWVPAVEGCAYVFHVASPFPGLNDQIPEEDLIRQAVGGVENVLAACVESGTVKRVVVTSSVAAVSSGMAGNPGRPEDHMYTEDDWSVEDACGPYEKSKLKAERAAWAFVEKLEKDKKFELVVVNPAYIQGPLLSAASGAGTASLAIMLLDHKMPALPNVRTGIVDVRDVVAGEIAAMFTPSAAGKRFILCGGSIDFKDFALVVRDEFQSQGYNIPTGTIPKFILWGMKFFDQTVKAAYPGVNKRHTWSNERMKTELGVTPRSINQSILDTCYSVIECGLATKKPGYLGPPEKRDKPLAAEGGEAKPTEGDKTEPTPTEAESKPVVEPAEKPGDKTEQTPTEAESKPVVEPAEKPGDKTEQTPTEAESKPVVEPAKEPGDKTEQTPTEAESKPAVEPAKEPGDKTEQTPTEAESKPAVEPDEEPKPADSDVVEPSGETEPKPSEGGDPEPSEGGEGGDLKPSEGGDPEPSEGGEGGDSKPSEGGDSGEAQES